VNDGWLKVSVGSGKQKNDGCENRVRCQQHKLHFYLFLSFFLSFTVCIEKKPYTDRPLSIDG
jgi:hypothetical protein